ncbi:tRNA isopentenyl-2-thiomethyl-A-37 hydroxylase MiaE [Alteromonas flava]|uniref:tRNA isopentenyl-2-thiomethyl-A-37 hydroxylase MiaE n=1 Tax=Alteromonas flava TaxID=2048003 RepID=UPI000C284CB2|nr:tRNA isopentenyl-2-thiomethyl-A-37 hydroxylase MiaE [Alteromonas flava]
MQLEELLEPVSSFLHCETPMEWIDYAKKEENLPIILQDHLACELKAAQTAMLLIRKYAVDENSGNKLLAWLQPYEAYVYRQEGSMEALKNNLKFTKALVPKSESDFGQELIDKMVLLIKEELHHFYQVLEIMEARGIPYKSVSAGRYAKGLMRHVRTHEPATLIDKLICGAYIEARSCERFAKLAPYLDDDLNTFYVSLLRSEARHYQDYLKLAQKLSETDLSERIKYFGEVEKELIMTSDSDFKFHSGVPDKDAEMP